MWIIITVTSTITAIVVFLVFITTRGEPYTNEEWDDICKADFKKYGTPPQDQDICTKHKH
jgi:hypothetical protein